MSAHGGDFIETYDNALDAALCAELIAHFNASEHVARGSTAGGVNTRLKDSWDICISNHAEWKQIENHLNSVMLHGLMAYVRKYSFLALAPLTLSRKDATSGELRQLGVDDIRAMPDEELQTLLVKVFQAGTINLQKYIAGEGGYPYWHSEISPKVGDESHLRRVLLWSLYLNDDFSEGETEFAYQQRKITPRTGSLLIAPAGFTHTHRGNTAYGGDKYIATSWVLFQPAEALYA